MPHSTPKNLEYYMDDVHMFSPSEQPESDVLLGVYNSEEWIFTRYLRARHLAGVVTVQLDVTWLIPSNFNLIDWAAANAKVYTFFSSNRVIVQEDKGILKVTSGHGKIEVEHVGEPAWVKAWVVRLDTSFKRAESLVEWVYSDNREISIPLNYRPAIKSAYPWIKQDLYSYIDDYINSEASVLILIGRPGTGKTTFVKNVIHRSGRNAKVAYDEKVMLNDYLFASFIDDDSCFLVMEDADSFLQSRADGNTMMHKFLNVSDGLISAADKKLIFSTNLPNISDIDPALIRPGRCFDVLEFRPLTVKEAEAVIAESGSGQLPPGKTEITLAEIFSSQPSVNVQRKGPGFL